MDDKIESLTTTSTKAASATVTASEPVDELTRIVDNLLNPVTTTPRNYTPPVMGTSARAVKHRIEKENTPIRLEGTDTVNQNYPSVRPTENDQQTTEQQSVSLASTEASIESQQSFNAKRDFFEERLKNSSMATYDSPPRQTLPSAQQIITTITTTTTSLNNTDGHDRTSSSSNESPSVDHVLEQAVELQRLSQATTTSNTSKAPSPEAVIIERTEQYQVFLDAANHEIRRTPSVSRTTLVPITKAGHATDLDEAQAQVERLTDDHQAIQQLTRALHEHTQATNKEYKRLPSTPKTIEQIQIPLAAAGPEGASAVTTTTSAATTTSPFSVIDALINNPLGTNNDRSNSLSQTRYQDIISNVRNPEWIHSLKESTPKGKKDEKSKKPKKEKKPKEEKPKEKKPAKEKAKKEKKSKDKKKQEKQEEEQVLQTTHLTTTTEQQSSPSTEPVVTTSSEQTPLIDPKDKKKEKTKKSKKSKVSSKDIDYQVIDAIIGSPITSRLPEPYLNKYKVSPPLPTSTLVLETLGKTTEKTSSTDNQTSPSAATVVASTGKENSNNETISELGRIVNELHLHHAAALTASVQLSQPKTTTKTTTTTTSNTVESKKSPVVTQAVVEHNVLLSQGHSSLSSAPTTNVTVPSTSTELQSTPSATSQTKVLYRYMDEQGRILAISSTPPSQLRDQAPTSSSTTYVYRNIPETVQRSPPVIYQERHITVDDERRHPLAQYEHRSTWPDEPKLPMTTTREDFELRDKRIPQISDHQTGSAVRTIPVSYEAESTMRISSTGPSTRQYHYPNQQNVKLAWLPLSYPNEPMSYTSNPTAGYETDSTISERSANYRPYDYAPVENHYHPSQRSPVYYQDYHHHNRSPGATYYPAPPNLPYSNNRGLSPDYGQSRNYLEVFRGGDFRETKPSEIYSLPLNEYSRRSPLQPSTHQRHSRYDQYQSEKYGTNGRRSIPSLQTHPQYSSHIPSSSLYTSSQYTRRTAPEHRPVHHSPPSAYTNSTIRHSKSFDYRPLRTKLQREYKITPNLLVDEWDYPSVSDKIHYSTATSTTNRSGVSSPDDVFLSNRTSTG